MSTQQVSNLTIDELRAIIQHEIDQRLAALAPRPDPRTPRQILDSIKRLRWTPPPGSPSTLELLREGRDR